jgi:imidazolonepropionase-like amidohydrolase
MLIRLPHGDPYTIGIDGTRFVESAEATVELPDTSDLWALPGLADCHAHVTMNSLADFDAITDESMAASIPTNTWAHLEHGVLLILDKGGKSDATMLTLDHDADLRPYVETAGSMISPPTGYYDRFGTEVEPDALVDHIATRAATGGGWVKLVGDWPRKGQGPVNNWSLDVLTEAVSTAHAAGARVAIHSMAHSASEAVAAGVDSIEHGPFLSETDLKLLAGRDGAWVPTIVNMLHLRDMLGADSSGGRMFQEGLERIRNNLPIAEALGVTVLAGTDMAVPHGKVAVEAQRLHEYGLSAAGAVAATSTSAYEYVGRPVRPAPGDEADVVFFERNPVDDVDVLGDPALIIRRGRVIGQPRG